MRNNHHLWIVFTMVAYVAFIGIRLKSYHFDVTRFIVAGDRYSSEKDLRYKVAVEPGSDGYDGQFYYRLALDPLTDRRTDFGITLDNPAVRSQRILYPAAAWTVSLGHGALVPYALVALNLLALAGMAWAAVALAAHFSVPARFGMLIPFYPGFVFSIERDTGEAFATCFALCGLLAATKRRYAMAAALASAAVLTRESTLFYLAGFGILATLDDLRRRRSGITPLYCLAPLVVYVAWQAFLTSKWGSVPASKLGAHDLSIVPFEDYLRGLYMEAVKTIAAPFQFKPIFELGSLLSVGVFLAYITKAAAPRGMLLSAYGIPWVLYAALMSLFTDAVWNEPYGFLRILCDFYVLGIILIIASGNQAALQMLAPLVAAMWLATAIYR